MYFFLCIVIGLFIYFLYRKCSQLSDRITRLEKRLLSDQSATVDTSAGDNTITSELIDTIPLKNEPNSVVVLFRWLVIDWPMKLGAFLILLGFGWLTTYAFLNNWIGPIGRITLGMAGGIGILLLGNWRMNKSRPQGAVLIGLGSSVFLLTIFAARVVYNFFTPATALGMMAVIALFIGFASWQYDSLALGVLGLLAGGIAPLLTYTVHPNFFGLFSYIFVLCLGVIWLATVKGWRVLILLSLALAFLYSVPFFFGGVSSIDKPIALLFACLFGILFYGAGLSTMAFAKECKLADIFVAAINAFFIIFWITTVIPDHLQSVVTTGFAVIFAVGAFALFQITSFRNLFYTYASVAIALLAVATAFELHGSALIIAYTIEAGLVALGTAYLLDNYSLGACMGFLLSIPVLLSGESIGSFAWSQGVFHDDFFVLLILSLTLCGLGLFFNAVKKYKIDRLPSIWLIRLYIGLGSIYAYILLWLSLHAAIASGTNARMITLIIYTVLGIVFYLSGLNKKLRGIQFEGEALFGFVVLDLLFIEIWHMTLLGKVMTFLLIGSLLISTIFLRRENKKEENITAV